MTVTVGRGWWYIIVVLPVSWIVQYVLFSGMVPTSYYGLYMYVPALIAVACFLFFKHPAKEQAALFIRKTGL